MPKFEIGEIADVWNVPGKTWHPCEIKSLGKITGGTQEYAIFVPDEPGPIAGLWLEYEPYLRKKKPPEQQGAREWWDENINEEDVVVTA